MLVIRRGSLWAPDTTWFPLSSRRIPGSIKPSRIISSHASCCNAQKGLYRGIKNNVEGPHLQTEEVYLRALEDRPRFDQRAYYGTHDPWAVDSEKRMVNGRESMCNSLMEKHQCVRLHLTVLHRLPSQTLLSQVYPRALKS